MTLDECGPWLAAWTARWLQRRYPDPVPGEHTGRQMTTVTWRRAFDEV